MRHIKSITSEIVDLYFPPLGDGIKAGYIRTVDILSRFIRDTVEEESRTVLKDISEELYEEIRQVSLSSYCFDVSGIRKSEFRPGGGGWIPYTEYGISFHRNFARMWNDMIKEAAKERRETPASFKVLSIDIETYGSNDISSCGVYKYAEAKDLLSCFSLIPVTTGR